MIISISGRINSGKDTVGKIIQWLIIKAELEKVIKDRPQTIPITPFEMYNFKNTASALVNTATMASGWTIQKWAAKLKEIASVLTGIPVEDMEKQSVKDAALGSEWNLYQYKLTSNLTWVTCTKERYERKVADKVMYDTRILPMTLRWLLQHLGTEAIRGQIHPNAWVNALRVNYKTVSVSFGIMDLEASIAQMEKWSKQIPIEFPNWIITDTRFPNEYDAIMAREGITIIVSRHTHPNEPDPSTLHISETALDNHEFKYVINNSGTIEDLIEQVHTILVAENIIEPLPCNENNRLK